MGKSSLIILTGLLIGSLAGFAFWYFIGCDSGGCAITSNWTSSTLYGTMMGGLGAGLFTGNDKKKGSEEPAS
jgi:hypothetical protein